MSAQSEKTARRFPARPVALSLAVALTALSAFAILYMAAQGLVCAAVDDPSVVCSLDARRQSATISLFVVGAFFRLALVAALSDSPLAQTTRVAALIGIAIAGAIGASITLFSAGFMIPPPWPW